MWIVIPVVPVQFFSVSCSTRGKYCKQIFAEAKELPNKSTSSSCAVHVIRVIIAARVVDKKKKKKKKIVGSRC